MKTDVTITINGEPRILTVEPNDVLLDVLRTTAGVKSPKIGCERGDCGSCTVLLDGKSVRSCLVLGIEVGGHEVTTVEGLDDAALAGLEHALVAMNAFQCGFCAPGIVIAAAELLGHEPLPTREQVQHAIAGNLCRCTGYEPIIDAVLAAAEERSVTA